MQELGGLQRDVEIRELFGGEVGRQEVVEGIDLGTVEADLGEKGLALVADLVFELLQFGLVVEETGAFGG